MLQSYRTFYTSKLTFPIYGQWGSYFILDDVCSWMVAGVFNMYGHSSLFVYCCFMPQQQYFSYIMTVIWCTRWEGESLILHFNDSMFGRLWEELAFGDAAEEMNCNEAQCSSSDWDSNPASGAATTRCNQVSYIQAPPPSPHMVIAVQVLNCESTQSRQLHSSALLINQAASSVTWYSVTPD